MSVLGRLFGRKPAPEQAVLVHLDGLGLPEAAAREDDLASLEDQLTGTIERAGLGEFDGNETGPTSTTLFMYGPDAERLFAGVEQVLRGHPACRGARVEIRRGGPGAGQREVRL
jgi:hypothetical protein